MEPLTEQEALVGVAFCAAFADGTMGAEESEDLAEHLAACRALSGMDEDRLRDAMVKADRISAKEGEPALLAKAASALRPDLRATAFFLGADLVLADGLVADEERGFVERLRKALGIEPALAHKIVEIILIWHRA